MPVRSYTILCYSHIYQPGLSLHRWLLPHCLLHIPFLISTDSQTHTHLTDFYSHCASCEAVLREVSIAPSFALFKSLLKSLTIFQLIASLLNLFYPISFHTPTPLLFLLSSMDSLHSRICYMYVTSVSLFPLCFPAVWNPFTLLTHTFPACIPLCLDSLLVSSHLGGPLTGCFPHLPHTHISKKQDGGHKARYFITWVTSQGYLRASLIPVFTASSR